MDVGLPSAALSSIGDLLHLEQRIHDPVARKAGKPSTNQLLIQPIGNEPFALVHNDVHPASPLQSLLPGQPMEQATLADVANDGVQIDGPAFDLSSHSAPQPGQKGAPRGERLKAGSIFGSAAPRDWSLLQLELLRLFCHVDCLVTNQSPKGHIRKWLRLLRWLVSPRHRLSLGLRFLLCFGEL